MCQAIGDLNSEVKTVSYKHLLSSSNAANIFNDNYDVILDATDNPSTRYLINDACQLYGKSLLLYNSMAHIRKTFIGMNKLATII